MDPLERRIQDLEIEVASLQGATALLAKEVQELRRLFDQIVKGQQSGDDWKA